MTDLCGLVVVSDIHAGCKLGLMPKGGVTLDEGNQTLPSPLQRKVYEHWEEFWNVHVPLWTKGRPYGVVFNGDAVDGVHHGSTTQVTHNLTDQVNIAYQLLAPVVDACGGNYWHIRGTEAHVGKSAQEEEALAKRLGAKPDDNGNCARWELWKRMDGALVHFTHHIGTTGSSSYESTAVWKEAVELFVESGRWGDSPADVVVRSHRHRYMKVETAGQNGQVISVVTPAWQLKTPFTFRVAGARLSQPQLGGIFIRVGDEDGIYVRNKVWRLERPREE